MGMNINNLRKQNPDGIKRSNLMGWHSKNFDLQNHKEPKLFIDKIYPYLKEMNEDMDWDKEKYNFVLTEMWAIINPKNASNAEHTHPENVISSAYYLKAPKDCGNLNFIDPRIASSMRHVVSKTNNDFTSNILRIKPEEGMLVLFPSWLTHSVDPNMSSDERVVISFNINLRYKEAKE